MLQQFQLVCQLQPLLLAVLTREESPAALAKPTSLRGFLQPQSQLLDELAPAIVRRFVGCNTA